jgi:MoaA/NifB/PqqE/SkfB family radical SAM enzyme
MNINIDGLMSTPKPEKGGHTFLKSSINISSNDFLEKIKNYDLSTFSLEDRVILKEILKDIEEFNAMPGWWTCQESKYIYKLENVKRILKYVVFRYKFRNFSLEKKTDFPMYVLIEPVSSCNLRCPFCFQIDPEFNKKPYPGVMKIDLFKRVVDECEKNGVGAITLASRGEPTLHPKLIQMLEYLKDKFFEVKINTNATKLTDKLCHAFFQNNVSDIVLSIDTEKKELFEVLRKNASFEKVLDNVKKLYEIREKHYPNCGTVIRISGVKCKDEQDDVSFVNFWKNFSDEITISKIEERWDTYNNSKHPDLTRPCEALWERTYIWHDGTVNTCDVDYKSKLSPGILSSNNSIKSIWNSDKYNKLRELHSNNSRGKCFPCDRCGVSD